MTTHPLRVLDLTDGLALMAGRLLVGTGADVIRIEPDNRTQQSEAARLHWHAGKRVVRTAPEQLDALIMRLAADADVVVESGSVAELRTTRLREVEPKAWEDVAHVVVTPFGLTGPRAGWSADDAVAAAAGGMAWLGGDPGSAPTPPPRDQATQLAGAHAAIAALLAVFSRRRTGQGQFAEISVQEAVAALSRDRCVSWIRMARPPVGPAAIHAHVAPCRPHHGRVRRWRVLGIEPDVATCSPGWSRRARPSFSRRDLVEIHRWTHRVSTRWSLCLLEASQHGGDGSG
ncbi:CoA transferase, partial [Nocardioides alcanivorans]|uniref:CoA transferase n=1 Tax=Nocardioides alcanivorans TaxID=2897352 RepID=UPI001F225894